MVVVVVVETTLVDGMVTTVIPVLNVMVDELVTVVEEVTVLVVPGRTTVVVALEAVTPMNTEQYAEAITGYAAKHLQRLSLMQGLVRRSRRRSMAVALAKTVKQTNNKALRANILIESGGLVVENGKDIPLPYPIPDSSALLMLQSLAVSKLAGLHCERLWVCFSQPHIYSEQKR